MESVDRDKIITIIIGPSYNFLFANLKHFRSCYAQLSEAVKCTVMRIFRETCSCFISLNENERERRENIQETTKKRD